MRVFYVFRDITGGVPTKMHMSNHKPVRTQLENGDVQFTRGNNEHDKPYPFIEVTPLCLQGLGINPASFPAPGECKKLGITSAGDKGTTQEYFDSLHEKV